MNYCHYTLKANGQEFTSYSELLNYLDEVFSNKNELKQLDKITDIVFSRADRQASQIDKLNSIKVEGLTLSQTSMIDGEPSFDQSKLNVLSFLDMPQCNIDHKPLVTPFNIDAYTQESIKHLVDDLGIDPESAEKQVSQEIEQWKYLRNDAKFIHLLGDSKILFENDAAKYQDLIADFVPDSMQKVAISLRDQLHGVWVKEKGKYLNSKAIQGLNVKAELSGLDKEIFGHIDWLFVGEDGTLHMYILKTTTQNPREWAGVKADKYRYQLAFLKQMLAYNGVNTKNIDLNVIPVRIAYDSNGVVSSAKVQATIQYSTKKSGNGYSMHKFDRQVAHFIKDNSIPYHISSQPISRALEVNKAIFPTVNLRNEGIGQSAKEWIKYAPSIDPEGTEPLVISQVNDIDHAYEVTIKGEKYNIKSNKPKEKNQEILDLVSRYVSDLEDSKGYSTQRLKEAILNSYDKGFMTFSTVPGLKSIAIQLESVLGKYLNDYVTNEKTGKREYTWELLSDLIDANILVFKNNEDNTLDIITLSSFDLRAKAPIRQGRNNILGYYRRDSEYIDLEGDYGNVEAVRTMELLNEMLPQLGSNVKLGTLGVLSSINGAAYRSYNIGEFNKNYFQNIITVVNKENSGLNIENNFSVAQFTDPVEEILKEYITITTGKSEAYVREYTQYGFDELKETDNDVVQMHSLENILNRILTQYPSFSDPEEVEKALAQPTQSLTRNMATLYELTARAYLTLRGETPKNKNYLNGLNTIFFTAPTVDSENIKIVVNNLQITHDTIAEEFLKEYDSNIRGMFDQFYKKQGYTSAQNMIVGNQAQQYSNFFNPDDKLMSFKNPYDTSNDLKPQERELLKEVLFRIDKINRNGNSRFYSSNDPKIKEWIKAHPEYLWVPLERASSATKRQSAEAILAGMKNFCKKVKDASTAFDEFVEGITDEERELLGRDSDSFYRMHLKNPFSLSMPTSQSGVNETMKSRKALLDKYGKGFFETNVENILVDFLAKHISTTQYNKLLIASKALMLELHITGNYNGNKETVSKEIKYMQDYLKTNVFHTSIMSPAEKKIVGVISPIKRIVSHMLLGANIVSALRDSIEGAQQNFIRSVIKLNTDLNPKDISKAYAYVWTHSSSNAMAQNLLSKLCLRYRISNTDVGRIAEKAKTGRNGILNYENWMYSTLRGPDFLNRMTLFVAKCMHDGVWEAISLDPEGNLKYDWTKDARFKAFKYGVVGSEEYKKAKSLYFSRVREYNQEHPDNPIEMTDNLPEPYSKRMINAIRGLGDNIYGSYDKGKKAMEENASYGFLFGSFSTWMNGIINNYFMPTQKNGVSSLKLEQEIDDKGNKLFFDEHGNITNEDTGMPVYKNVPIIVQGIFPTLSDLINITKEDGLKAAVAYVKGNNMVKANVFKLTSDALMFALLGSLFGLLLTPAYKEHKKTAADNPVLVNLLTEILYKSSSRSYDQYKGPINVIQFFGENMNPPYYSAPINLLKDAGQSIFGDKSWKYLIFDNTGLTRSIKDTAFTYIKSKQQ